MAYIKKFGDGNIVKRRPANESVGYNAKTRDNYSLGKECKCPRLLLDYEDGVCISSPLGCDSCINPLYRNYSNGKA